MSWAMYEVWMSTGGALRPGPRFRSLADALFHVRTHAARGSFAIRTPDGRWHRDTTGRSILGRREGGVDRAALARGSRPIDVSAHRATGIAIPEPRSDEETDEHTDVGWPPDDGPKKPRKIFG
jgi:hypothetical protein